MHSKATGFLLTIGGYILGHQHGGRTFSYSLHAIFASIIMAPIATQIILGTYLKLHINEGTPFRRWMVFSHRIVGLSYISFGWVQVLFGMLVLGDICPLGDDTPFATVVQCAEPVGKRDHFEPSLNSTLQFFTGSFLMQYGIYSYLFSLILPRWGGQSPETWDSSLLWVSVSPLPL